MINIILLISFLIMVLVIGAAVLVTKKAYEVKEEIDPIEGNPHLSWRKENE